ncbi:hypothetical protein [Mesomycoplasma ovipneumoniae]
MKAKEHVKNAENKKESTLDAIVKFKDKINNESKVSDKKEDSKETKR